MQEKLHEECGVFGIYDNDNLDVVTSTYLALYALQHRGQESCGIAVNDDGVIRSYRDLGLVTDVFKPQVLEKLGSGKMAIGHCLYGTAESDKRENAQPMTIRHVKGQMAIANNGVVLNAYELRQKLELQGAIFHSTSDAELIAHMITRERLTAGSIEEAICNAMDKLYGTYSMLVMSPKKLIGVRDPLGMRPLSIGKCENSYVLASETAALDSMGAHFVRDVKPGEIVIIDENGLRSIEKHCGKKSHLCVFEFVYFARPDSVIEGTSVHLARQKMGEFLAKEHPVEADLVMGVPDSGNDAALGYANASGIPYGIGLIKNKYIGRTFILNTQKQRENAVRIKLNAIADIVRGKRLVLVDDSIVRGTTSARIVGMLREAGAKEVHMRISSPPFRYPCYFGTDIDSPERLIANNMTIPEIGKKIGVDSLGFLSLQNIVKVAEHSDCQFCTGCFSGEYPLNVENAGKVSKFDRKISENND